MKALLRVGRAVLLQLGPNDDREDGTAHLELMKKILRSYATRRVLQDHSLPKSLRGYICHEQRTGSRQAAFPLRESSAAPVCINQLVLTAA